MRLALVQMPNYGSKDENLYKSLQAIEIASKQGAVLNRSISISWQPPVLSYFKFL